MQHATDRMQQAPHCRQHETVATCNVEPTRREACNMWRGTSVSDVAVHRPYWDHPCHVHTGTRLARPALAPGLGSPVPHLRHGWAPPAHTCAEALSTCPPAAAGYSGVPQGTRPRLAVQVLGEDPAGAEHAHGIDDPRAADGSLKCAIHCTGTGLASRPHLRRDFSAAHRGRAVRCACDAAWRRRQPSAAAHSLGCHCAEYSRAERLCVFAFVLRAVQFSSRSR